MECFDVASADRFFEYQVCKPSYGRSSKPMAARILEGFQVACEAWLAEYEDDLEKMKLYDLLLAKEKFASKLNEMQRRVRLL
jgi:hypothetical protein